MEEGIRDDQLLAESTEDRDSDCESSTTKKRLRLEKFCNHCNLWVPNSTFYRLLRNYRSGSNNAEQNQTHPSASCDGCGEGSCIARTELLYTLAMHAHCMTNIDGSLS